MRNGPSDQANSAYGIDKIVESIDDLERSAVAVGQSHETTNVNNGANEVQSEDEVWETLNKVNDTLKNLETSYGENSLKQYINLENNPEEFRFGGFTSCHGISVEQYTTELANELDLSDSDQQYQSLLEVPDETIEQIGEIYSSLTESFDKPDQDQGKYIASFKLYGEKDLTQMEISDRAGVNQADLSNRKTTWKDQGIIDEDGYTEAGRIINDMIDDIYSLKEQV